jgi:hypothetical protein
MRTLRLALASLALSAGFALLTAPLAAQGNNFYDRTSVTSGAQFKGYSFGDGAEFEQISQIAVPIAMIVPISQRFSFDIGASYAVTSTTTSSQGDHSVSGFTDTQLRGTYVLGRDAAVLSLVVNVPTGTKLDSADAITAGAAASNFLSFPVNSYNNGLSLTGGAGLARRAGAWGIGFAGSFRWNAEYQPYEGSLESIKYEPGVEGRIRVGADRSIGEARLRLGLTFSTFGDDVYSGFGAGAAQNYKPGQRIVGEASYAWPGLGGTVSAYVWDYYRMTGEADGSGNDNSENILTGGFLARLPMGPKTLFEPGIEGRYWRYNAGEGGGKVVGLAAGIRHRLTDDLSLVPNIRAEFGSLDLVGGGSSNLTGLGASVLIRYGL